MAMAKDALPDPNENYCVRINFKDDSPILKMIEEHAEETEQKISKGPRQKTKEKKRNETKYIFTFF